MNLLDIHTHSQGNPTGIFNGIPKKRENIQPFSIGLHPWYLKGDWEQEVFRLEQYLNNPNLFAVGECGFDLVKGPPPDLQMAAFKAQADLAKKYDLPLILHCVKGLHLLQKYLKTNVYPPFIIWHGFNLKSAVVENLHNFPVYFSFGEALFQNNANAKKCLKECPLDRVFFETDISEKNISAIYEQASLILGIPVYTLDRQVRENWMHISKRIFK
ncbi:TatD family hydrolase [Cecembia sp.]|uniref:TatD family hydrolase n=2 Tax=Cecembia sp. TaxID=1898110 RepID=UPI0025C5B02F|nr:TatD family hydrolase [Cecembia sp.]